MLWLKAFHIIFVVCWFAGLFYLPAYSSTTPPASTETRQRLAVMARQLYGS